RFVCAFVLVAAAGSADAASLTLSSGTLQLESVVGSGATATVSMAGGDIVVSASEAIELDGSLTGWSGDGTTSVSGPASVMTAGFFVFGFASLTFAGDFTAPGTITINPPVLLAANVHLSAATGITLAGALDSAVAGSYDFVAEVTGAGNVIVSGNIGALARPGSLSFSVGAGGFIELPVQVTSSGAQLYLGAVALVGSTLLTGQPIALGDVAGGALALQGDTTFAGQAGSATSELPSLTVVSGTTTFGGGSVRTVNAQSYGDVILAADTTLVGSAVHLFGTVDGAHAFTIVGDAYVSDALGSTTALASLDVSGATTVTNALNALTIATTGDQHYAGAMTLAADLSASGAAITHDRAVDGAQALTITAATGYHAGGAVGATTPLTAFAVHGPATWAGGALTTTASVHFYDALALASGFDVASPQIVFDGTVDGSDPLSATGTTTFGAAVGGTTPLAALTVEGATHLTTASVSNIGAQQYLGPLVVSAATTALATGSFAITFGGPIDRANGGPLALTTTTHTGIVFASGATCDFVLAGPTAGSEYTQIVSDGAVTLNDCALHATSTAPVPFAAGTELLVVSGGPVTGTLAGLAQGAHTTIGGQDFTVDYAHGGVGLIAQAGADMAGSAPADLATTTPPNDLAGQEVDLGAADMAAAPNDAASGGRHGGCNYTSGDDGSAAGLAAALFMLLALARRRQRSPA
ncbi:MAG TPA: hypothetical protein VIA18_01240, partial [Polyangia bacterium]|nr:hypothetical protein [Polyangia bacterium]